MGDKGKEPMPSVAQGEEGESSGQAKSSRGTRRIVFQNEGEASGAMGQSVSFEIEPDVSPTADDEPPSPTKPAVGAGKKKWGKVKMMAAVQGTMGNLADSMRDEAKRQMQLRIEARKKMEMRTRMFQNDEDDYDSIEYLPGLHRGETFFDEKGLQKAASTMKGADGILRSTTMAKLPQKGEKNKVAEDKTHLIFAALRGKLPQKEAEQESLVAQATDDIALDVALEETAEVYSGKDGKIYKKYRGFDSSVDDLLGKMKRDVFGRTVRPWKNLSKTERSWLVASWLYVVFDFFAIVFFVYLAFFLFRNDTHMDPLAWQLAFGMTAVFTAIHMLYLVFEFIDYFTVWLLFVVCLTVGLFYGGVTYFLEIYTGEFTCFHASGIEQHAFGICYEGRLLLGMMLGCCSLLLAALYLWQWRLHKRLQLKQRGEYTEKLDLEELLTQVDLKFEKYKLLGGKDFISDMSPSGSQASTLGVGRPLDTLRLEEKPEKQKFLSRMLSPAKGVNHNMTSTALRGATHAVPAETRRLEVMPAGNKAGAALTMSSVGSPGTVVRPRLLGQSTSITSRAQQERDKGEDDKEAELEKTVGRMKHTNYLPPMSLSPTKPSKPHTEIEDAIPTRKISVAPKTVSSKSLLLDGLPSIAPLERTATMARKSMRKIHPNSVSAVLSSSKKTTRSLVKQS